MALLRPCAGNLRHVPSVLGAATRGDHAHVLPLPSSGCDNNVEDNSVGMDDKLYDKLFNTGALHGMLRVRLVLKCITTGTNDDIAFVVLTGNNIFIRRCVSAPSSINLCHRDRAMLAYATSAGPRHSLSGRPRSPSSNRRRLPRPVKCCCRPCVTRLEFAL